MSKHECTIVIDTNQFCSDMMLSGLRWKRLIEYVDKTGACMQMPRIVWQEIYRNYAKTVSSHYANAVLAIEKLNHHIGFSSPALNFWGERYQISDVRGACTDLAGEATANLAKAYLAHIKNTLKLKAKDFIETDSSWFDEVIERAVNHVKPFSDESDKGFKDTLLWKSVLSLKQRPGFKDHPIILISSNSRDFGSPSEKGKLHQSLAKEAESAGLDLHYFDNLDAFLQNWAADIIATDLESIRKIVSESMIKAELEVPLTRWMRRNEAVRPNLFFTGTNFKIESAAQGKKVIRASVSGYLTNTNTPYPYLDFNAEMVYHEEMAGRQLTVEALSIPVEGLIKRLWPEEREGREVSYPFLELYGAPESAS